MRALEDVFTRQLVPPITADRLLWKGFADENAARHVDAIGAYGGAELEMIAASAERADGRVRICR